MIRKAKVVFLAGHGKEAGGATSRTGTDARRNLLQEAFIQIFRQAHNKKPPLDEPEGA
jgi:hypothetical protein